MILAERSTVSFSGTRQIGLFEIGGNLLGGGEGEVMVPVDTICDLCGRRTSFPSIGLLILEASEPLGSSVLLEASVAGFGGLAGRANASSARA